MTTKQSGKFRGFRFLVFFGLVTFMLSFLGSGQSGVLTIDDSTVIIPTNAFDRLGGANSIAVGDFNDDGFQDILVGAPFADRPEAGSPTADNGVAYVIFGKDPFPQDIDLKSFTNADVVIVGTDFGDHLGTSVAAGDVNGDGISDMILGAPDADGPLNQDSETGEVYVVFGSTKLDHEFDLLYMPAPVTLIGRVAQAGFGSTLAAIDMNGDGIKDIVVGQPKGNGPGGSRPDGGAVFVYFGKPGIVSPIPDIGYKPADMVIYGQDAGDMLGSSLTGGDFNGDGLSDLVMGAPMADGAGNQKPDAGEVYILSGAFELPAQVDLAGSTTTGTGSLMVIGGDEGDRLGTSVGAGNANQDAYDDLLIGAPMAGGRSNLRGFSGEAYLFLGEENLPPVIDLKENIDIAVRILGANALDGLGSAVAINDTDGDGFAELVVSASNARGGDQDKAGAGAVYVIKGRGLFASSFDLADDTANVVIRGLETGAAFGSAIAIGNLEGDEKGNLLVGAVGADGPGGRRDSGLVYVFLTVEKEPPLVPIADAGPDWCVVPGGTVTLDGSGSRDAEPGAGPLTYQWSIISAPTGSDATLNNADTSMPTITPDIVGEYVIELMVSTVKGATATDQVTVYALEKGDVNFDGVIDQTDAQLVADYIVGLVVFTDLQRYAADVRPFCLPHEFGIDVNDVRWIAEFPFKGPQEPTCRLPLPKPRTEGPQPPPPTNPPTQPPGNTTPQVAGEWTGTLVQSEGPGIGQYVFSLNLTQANTTIGGTSRIEIGNSEFFGVMSLEGAISGTTLTLQETEITSQNVSPTTPWCIKRAVLEIQSANNVASRLSGSWDTADSCGSGTIELTRSGGQPTIEEVCGDGIDNDNDGLVDEDCQNAQEIFLDDICDTNVVGLTVDGVDLGMTPQGKGRFYPVDLAPGNHELIVTATPGTGDTSCADIEGPNYAIRLGENMTFLTRAGTAISGNTDSQHIERETPIIYTFNVQ